MGRTAIAADPHRSREAPAARALVVRPRHGVILLVGLAGAAIAVGMFFLRQDDLEFDDALETALLLALGIWLVTQAIGLVVRRFEAGHAMRIDAAGLHHPGWDVVPWHALRRAWLQPSKKVLGMQRHDLMLDIDPACKAPSAGSYVRWMFGPVEGLGRSGKPIRIPLVGLAVEPDALLASIEAMRRASPIAGKASKRPPP